MQAMTNKEIKGKAVVSIGEGERVGRIDRVYFDPKARQVVGFALVRGGGLLSSPDVQLIDVDDLHSVGPDALTLNDRSAARGDHVKTGVGDGSLIDIDDLTKEKVVTEGGEYVGQVASIEFDPAAFEVTGIEVSAGFFKSNRMIPIDLVTTIGPELVIVADSVCAGSSDEGADGRQRWVVGDVESTGETR